MPEGIVSVRGKSYKPQLPVGGFLFEGNFGNRVHVADTKLAFGLSWMAIHVVSHAVEITDNLVDREVVDCYLHRTIVTCTDHDLLIVVISVHSCAQTFHVMRHLIFETANVTTRTAEANIKALCLKFLILIGVVMTMKWAISDGNTAIVQLHANDSSTRM